GVCHQSQLEPSMGSSYLFVNGQLIAVCSSKNVSIFLNQNSIAIMNRGWINENRNYPNHH
ncbi:hypothetical protein, partial [Thermoactinomyces daqus]|uniref:hypothetical protein n=1 Tax=Thermoactinomyces daqus TaxID=1329516 RepID=UPI001F1F2B48